MRIAHTHASADMLYGAAAGGAIAAGAVPDADGQQAAERRRAARGEAHRGGRRRRGDPDLHRRRCRRAQQGGPPPLSLPGFADLLACLTVLRMVVAALRCCWEMQSSPSGCGASGFRALTRCAVAGVPRAQLLRKQLPQGRGPLPEHGGAARRVATLPTPQLPSPDVDLGVCSWTDAVLRGLRFDTEVIQIPAHSFHDFVQCIFDNHQG
eukprot:2868963-Rhodomonas_salina.1